MAFRSSSRSSAGLCRAKLSRLLHHLAAALGGLDDGLEGPVGGAVRRLGLQVGRGQAEDGPQHVVHVVGHAAGEAAQALHLLGLLELGLELALLLLEAALCSVTSRTMATAVFRVKGATRPRSASPPRRGWSW